MSSCELEEVEPLSLRVEELKAKGELEVPGLQLIDLFVKICVPHVAV